MSTNSPIFSLLIGLFVLISSYCADSLASRHRDWNTILGREGFVRDPKYTASAATQKAYNEYEQCVIDQQKLPFKKRIKKFDFLAETGIVYKFSYNDIRGVPHLKEALKYAHIAAVPTLDVSFISLEQIRTVTRNYRLVEAGLLTCREHEPFYEIMGYMYTHRELSEYNCLRTFLEKAYLRLIKSSIRTCKKEFIPNILDVQKDFLAYERKLELYQEDPPNAPTPFPPSKQTFKIGNFDFSYDEITDEATPPSHKLEISIRNAHLPSLPKDIFKHILSLRFNGPLVLTTPSHLRDFGRLYGLEIWHLHRGFTDPLSHLKQRNPLRLKHDSVVVLGGHWLKPILSKEKESPFSTESMWGDIDELILDHDRSGTRFDQFGENDSRIQTVPCKRLKFTTGGSPLNPDHSPFDRFNCPNLVTLCVENMVLGPNYLTHLALINPNLQNLTLRIIYADDENPIDAEAVKVFSDSFTAPVNFLFDECGLIDETFLRSLLAGESVKRLEVKDCHFISFGVFSNLISGLLDKKNLESVYLNESPEEYNIAKARADLTFTDKTTFKFKGRIGDTPLSEATDMLLKFPENLTDLFIDGPFCELSTKYWTPKLQLAVKLKQFGYTYFGEKKNELHDFLDFMLTLKTLKEIDFETLSVFKGTLHKLKEGAQKGMLKHLTLRDLTPKKGSPNYVHSFTLREIARNLESLTAYVSEGSYANFSRSLKGSKVDIRY